MRSLHRVLGLVGLAGRRLLGRLRRGERATVALSILGVALAISFMVIVTGISVGLTSQATIYGGGVDYWITPESSSSSTMAVSVGGPEFGAVHPTTDRIRSIEGVTYATPVKAELVRLGHGPDSTYVLLLGVLPRSGERVGGLSMDPLTEGDPHFANGSYDGPWTGDLVLSDSAASLLDATSGSTLSPGAGAEQRTFRVQTVEEASLESGTGPIPVGLVHLAELQTLTGGASQDSADRFLVQTTDPGVREELAGIYPQSRVVAQAGLTADDVSSSELALAIAVTAFVVALCVGALFVTTALGLELTADRSQHAAMTALGLSTRSQAVLVVTQTLLITVTGGLLGIIAGYGGIELANSLGARYAETTVATPASSIALYAFAVSVAIGLVSSPYLVWLGTRADPLTTLE